MAKPEEIERVLSHFHETSSDRDRLAAENIAMKQSLSVQEAENDRLQSENTRLSAERDQYQIRVAVLVNELGTIRNLISDAESKARDVSFGRGNGGEGWKVVRIDG